MGGDPSCIHVLSLDVYLCVFIHNNYPIYIMKTNINYLCVNILAMDRSKFEAFPKFV